MNKRDRNKPMDAGALEEDDILMTHHHDDEYQEGPIKSKMKMDLDSRVLSTRMVQETTIAQQQQVLGRTSKDHPIQQEPQVSPNNKPIKSNNNSAYAVLNSMAGIATKTFLANATNILATTSLFPANNNTNHDDKGNPTTSREEEDDDDDEVSYNAKDNEDPSNTSEYDDEDDNYSNSQKYQQGIVARRQRKRQPRGHRGGTDVNNCNNATVLDSTPSVSTEAQEEDARDLRRAAVRARRDDNSFQAGE
jgi:hypothetical protein